jgi:hypothetical protein
MKLILASVAAAIAILSVNVEPASAQPGGTRNPFCIRDGIGGPGSWDCSYHTWQQCIASVQGAGGICQANPWYEGPRPRQRPRADRYYPY